jgi:hypothetical protein
VKYAFSCALEIAFTIFATSVILEGPRYPAGAECVEEGMGGIHGALHLQNFAELRETRLQPAPFVSPFSYIEGALVVWVIGQMLYEAGQLRTHGWNRYVLAVPNVCVSMPNVCVSNTSLQICC